MVRRFAYLIVVLCLTIVVLAIPASRKIAIRQVNCAIMDQAYSGPLFEAGNYPINAKFQNRQATWDSYVDAVARPQSEDRDVVNRQLKASGTYADKFIQVYPQRPESYALAILALTHSGGFYNRIEQWNYNLAERRAGVIPTAKRQNTTYYFTDADPKTAARILQLATKASSIAPNNSYFDLMAAAGLYGLHRDEEAVDYVRKAARKPVYDSYNRQIVQSLVRSSEHKGMPGGISTSELRFIYFPDSLVRNVPSMTCYMAGTLSLNGKSHQAESLLVDLMRIGAVMRANAYSPEQYHQAFYFEQKLWNLWLPSGENFTKYWTDEKALHDMNARIAKNMTSEGWITLASSWEKEMQSSERSSIYMYQHFSNLPWDINRDILITGTVAETGRLALRIIAGLLLLALAMWPFSRILGGKSLHIPQMSVTGKAALTLLTVVPWLAMTLADVSSVERNAQLGTIYGADYSRLLPQFAMLLSLLLVSIWTVGLLVQYRLMSKPTAKAGWKSVVSLVLIISAMVFAGYWFAAAAVNLRIAAAAGPFTQNGRQGFQDGPLIAFQGITLLAIIACFVRLMYWRARNWGKPVSLTTTILAVTLCAGSFLVLGSTCEFLYPVNVVELIGPLITPGLALLVLIFVLFTAARMIVLMHRGICPSLPLCTSESIRSGALVLAKVMVVLYLVALLGQLPFRSSISKRLHSTARNEVGFMIGKTIVR